MWGTKILRSRVLKSWPGKKMSGYRRKKKKSMMVKSISSKKPGLPLGTVEAPRPQGRGDAGNHRRTFLALSSQFLV